MMLEMLMREDRPVRALARMCRMGGKILVTTWDQTRALGSVGGRHGGEQADDDSECPVGTQVKVRKAGEVQTGSWAESPLERAVTAEVASLEGTREGESPGRAQAAVAALEGPFHWR